MIEWDKLPKPDRSAGLGIVLMVGILWTMVTPVAGPSTRKPHWWEPFYCYVLPWNCGGDQGQAKVEQEKPRKYRVMHLVDLPGMSGKRECSCHFDFKFKGKPIQHISAYSESCDSDPIQSRIDGIAFPNKWITPQLPEDHWLRDHGGVYYASLCVADSQPSHADDKYLWINYHQSCIKPGEGQYRWHCE